jgi:hypothetical protein
VPSAIGKATRKRRKNIIPMFRTLIDRYRGRPVVAVDDSSKEIQLQSIVSSKELQDKGKTAGTISVIVKESSDSERDTSVEDDSDTQKSVQTGAPALAALETPLQSLGFLPRFLKWLLPAETCDEECCTVHHLSELCRSAVIPWYGLKNSQNELFLHGINIMLCFQQNHQHTVSRLH